MNRIAVLVLCAMSLAGQVAPPLKFEVASVKLIADPPGFFNTSLQITPRGFNANFAALRDRLESGLRALTPDAIIFGSQAERLPNTTLVAMPGAKAETLVIGFDLVKDPAVLERAYDDSAGVTGEFNLNVLRRLNRDLGADFDMQAFRQALDLEHGAAA